jgi:hypothetical protein
MSDDWRQIEIDQAIARRIAIRTAVGELTILCPAGLDPRGLHKALKRAIRAPQLITLDRQEGGSPHV